MNKSIFSYWNGQATVYADPMTVHRGLTLALDGNPQVALERLQKDESGEYKAPVPVALEALDKLLVAVRKVFSMPAIDPATGEGATDDECLAAVNAFLDWMEGKKKVAAGWPISLTPSAQPA